MPSLNTIAPIPSVNEEVLPRETHENQNEELIEMEPFPNTGRIIYVKPFDAGQDSQILEIQKNQ